MASDKPDSFGVGAFEVVPKADVRTFVEKLNRLREAVDQCRLQPGAGYDVQRSTNGTTLSIRPQAGGAVPAETYPWKVSLSFDGERKSYYYTVEPLSYLFNYNEIEVSNLTEKIYLETEKIEEVYHAVLQVDLDGSLGETFIKLTQYKKKDYPGLILPKAGPQTQSNTILASFGKGGRVVQAVRGNLTNIIVNHAGRPAIVPVTFLDYAGVGGQA